MLDADPGSRNSVAAFSLAALAPSAVGSFGGADLARVASPAFSMLGLPPLAVGAFDDVEFELLVGSEPSFSLDLPSELAFRPPPFGTVHLG